MSLGISGMAKIFCKILVFSPSMKYSMSVLSSLIWALSVRIWNWAMYLSIESFPYLSCLSPALASPSVSLTENTFSISLRNVVANSNFGGSVFMASARNASFQAFAVPSFIKDSMKTIFFELVS